MNAYADLGKITGWSIVTGNAYRESTGTGVWQRAKQTAFYRVSVACQWHRLICV